MGGGCVAPFSLASYGAQLLAFFYGRRTRLIPPNSDWHQTALVSYLFFIFLICDDADRKFYHLSVLAVHILYEPLCCPKDSESAFYEALTSRGAAQSRARLRAYGLGYEKFATGGSLSKLTGGGSSAVGG